MLANKTPLTPRGFTNGRPATLWREAGCPLLANKKSHKDSSLAGSVNLRGFLSLYYIRAELILYWPTLNLKIQPTSAAILNVAHILFLF